MDLWHLVCESAPRLQWGATSTRYGTHSCPKCHIDLLTGERPGFCCGPQGRYANTPPLPPLPPEYNAFINHRDISKSSRTLNLIFTFAAIETTHPFPTLTGGPSFVAIQGKVYHRIKPTHDNSCLRWLLFDGFMQDKVPFPHRAVQLPQTWITNVKNALLRVNPLIAHLQTLSNINIDDCPEAHLQLNDQGISSNLMFNNHLSHFR
ncbi:hypothetical protein FB446DRAFT_647954 [Lentinula raphanica]|nr:hypothetical protein FB446DRAFT_647954 [Lentinula raphanica]